MVIEPGLIGKLHDKCPNAGPVAIHSRDVRDRIFAGKSGAPGKIHNSPLRKSENIRKKVRRKSAPANHIIPVAISNTEENVHCLTAIPI
jgi:hypothetical protein